MSNFCGVANFCELTFELTQYQTNRSLTRKIAMSSPSPPPYLPPPADPTEPNIPVLVLSGTGTLLVVVALLIVVCRLYVCNVGRTLRMTKEERILAHAMRR